MFERFTKETREAVRRAQEEARGLRHGRIGDEHLLLAVLRTPEKPGVATLARLGVTAASCRAAVPDATSDTQDTQDTQEAAKGATKRHIPFTTHAKRTLELTLREARARGDRRIGTGHLTLALLRSEDRTTRAVFDRLGIVPEDVRELVLADLRQAE